MAKSSIAVLLAASLLAGCGDSGTTEPDPFADAPYQVVPCPAMVPSATSGVPMDGIALGKVPAELDLPLFGFVETDDADVYGYALVRVDAGGNVELTTPIHPSTSPDGGTAKIWVTDGTLACAPFDFTVEALTPAPGELAGLAAALQEIVDAQAADLETTSAALLTTPVDQLPAPLVPLAVVQSLLDDPDYDNSIMAIAGGTAAVSADVRLDLLEPLLARTGVRAAVEAAAASAVSAQRSGPAAAGPARVSAATCLPDAIGNDAGLLDSCMAAATDARFEIEGATGQVLSDMGKAFAVTGLVPGLEVPSAIAGFISWLALNEKNRTAALLPSTFTGMTVDFDPVEFEEDQAGPGSWSNAQVTATNLGWDLGKEFIEGALAGASLAGAFDKVDLGGGSVDDVLLYIATNHTVGDLIGSGTLEQFHIDPEPFGPVNVSDPQWSESKIPLGQAVELVSHTDYEPKEPGTVTLEVMTAAGKFGGQQAIVQQDLTVGTLQVTIAPDEVTLAPEQVQEFTVTVTGSAHPDSVEIDPSITLQGQAVISYNGDGTHKVTYTAPLTPDKTKTDLLTVRHTAESGARGLSSVPRNSIATIRFGGLLISADKACLEPDSTLQFTASDGLGGQPDVVWSADIGSISSSGLFTAPSQAGVAVVTGALASNPDVKDTFTVTIGGCSCRVSLVVDGVAADYSVDGLLPHFDLTPDHTAVKGVGWVGSLSSVGAGFGTDPAAPETIPIGTTGTFSAFAQGYQDGAGTYTSWQPDSTPLPVVAIIEQNDGTTFEGSVSGTVWMWTPDRAGQLTMTFHIESDPFFSGSYPDSPRCIIEGTN